MFRGLFTCSLIHIHMYQLMNSVNRLVNFKTVKSNYLPNCSNYFNTAFNGYEITSFFIFFSLISLFSAFPFHSLHHHHLFPHILLKVNSLDGFTFVFIVSPVVIFIFHSKWNILTSIVNMIRSFMSKQMECEIVYYCIFHNTIEKERVSSSTKKKREKKHSSLYVCSMHCIYGIEFKEIIQVEKRR